MNDAGFWGRLSVGLKIGAIVLIFIGALSGLTYFNAVHQEGLKRSSIHLELLGRQRVLGQLFVRDALVEAQGRRGDSVYWGEVFRKTLDGLLDGGSVIETLKSDRTVFVPPAPTENVREKLIRMKSSFERLENAAGRLKKGSFGAGAGGDVVDELLEESTRLHFTATEAVKALSAYFLSERESLIRTQIILGCAIALLGGWFSWQISRGIVLPLSSVVSGADEIARGNLNGSPLAVLSDDEIGRMTASFNKMRETLREITQQTHEGTRNLNSACQEILASTQQQATSTKEQACAVQETTATVEEVRQAGLQISERAAEVARASEQTSSSVESGIRAVRETTETMERIREQVESVAEKVLSLSEKTQAVEEIISTVNDIAEQSHLLALNAAIEAAAAGEAGRSFAVVAGEVKNLADRAKQSTGQIKSILNEIQKGITGSVMLTEEAVKRVETGRRRSGEAEKTIQQLSNATNESIRAFQQTVATTNQQQIGYDQVTQAMRDIVKASSQTASSTDQLEKSAAMLASLSEQLSKSVERFRL